MYPKIADFGLAKRIQKTDGPTLSGHVLGTPSYMPPEQASGHVNLVGPLADVYGLGGILYACLTGRAPFQAATDLDTLLQVLEKEPARPSSLNAAVPRDLETICLKCLEKRLERRYPSAQALADDLGRFLRCEPIRGRPAGTFRRAWTWSRQRPWVISAAIGIMLLVTGCLAYALWAQARQMRSDALYQQVRATRLEVQAEASTSKRHDRLLEEGWQQLREAARAAGSFPTAHLYDEALALLQLEGRASRRLLLPATTARQLERLGGGAEVSDDGKLVLISGTAEVLVLETDMGKVVHTSSASHSALDPRGRLLALAPQSSDKKPVPIRLIRLSDGKEVESLRPSKQCTELVFSPDGQRLAAANSQGVDVWNLRRKKWTRLDGPGGGPLGRSVLQQRRPATGRPLPESRFPGPSPGRKYSAAGLGSGARSRGGLPDDNPAVS
jgi:hypothetical protein